MSDKTEEPTPRRLQRARKDGDIAKSIHLSTTVSGGLWWLLLVLQAPQGFASFVHMIGTVMSIDVNRSFEWRLEAVMTALVEPGKTALAMLGFGIAAVVIPEVVQTRGLVAFKRVAPDFKRLNPVEGFKTLFGVKTMMDTALMLVQLSILIFVVWHAVAAWLAQIGPAYTLQPLSQLSLAARAHSRLLVFAALSQVAPAIADYALQHVLYKRRLRMEKHELKREYREDQGDPHVKGRRRALHKAINDPT